MTKPKSKPKAAEPPPKPKKPIAPAKASREVATAPKPAKKAPSPAEAPKGREGSMVQRILQLLCEATAKKPMKRAKLHDILVEEFVPPRKESDVVAWLNYFPGYLNQAGHTIHSEGRGADRTYWAERDTHEPFGRRFGKKK